MALEFFGSGRQNRRNALRYSRSGRRRFQCLVAFLLIMLAGFPLLSVQKLTYSRAAVENVDDPEWLSLPSPPGFVHQSSSAPGLLRFRRHIEHLLAAKMDTLQKVTLLLHWARRQQSWETLAETEPGWFESDNPEQLLAEQRASVPGSCRRFAYVLTGTLVSAGITARVVNLAADFTDEGNNHTLTEAWIPERNQWVLVDAMGDAFVFLGNQPVSALTALRALRSRSSRLSLRSGDRTIPMPPAFFQYKHLFVANSNALFDTPNTIPLHHGHFSFKHFVDEGIEPYPVFRKRSLATLGFCMLLLGAATFLRLLITAGAPADRASSPEEPQPHSLVGVGIKSAVGR